MRRRVLILMLAATMSTVTACGDGAAERAVVGTASTTSSIPAPSTTTTTAAPRTTAPTSTAPTTTAASRPTEEVVDRGTSPSGPWQLVAFAGPNGMFCAGVRVQLHDSGPRACNRPTEQDFNGDDTLRYAGGPSFVVGVTRPGIVKVAAQLRDGTVVERPTKAASFTSSVRFVALPVPVDAVIRSLTASDNSGNPLTRITINP